MRFQSFLLAILLLATALAGCAQDAAENDAPAPTGDDTETQTATPTQDTTAAVASCDHAALAASAEEAPRGSGTVTLLTHDSFNLDDSLVSAFQNESGYTLEVIKLGDAGEALNKAILQKDKPVGDALFGVDNNLIFRATQNDLFQPYVSPRLNEVPERFVEPFCTGTTVHATPISYGYVNLNYDPAALDERGVEPPQALRDIANPTYAPLTVVENPYTSSPGFAFLLATVDTFGTTGDYTYQDFWREFSDNGGKIVAGWEEAYGSWFTQGWDSAGAMDRPIVVSYSTSPAFNPMMGYTENATSANLDLPGSAWLQVESIGILQNAENPEGAKALVDFLLSPTFQNEVAMTFVTHPVLPNATTPDEYDLYAQEPAQPATLSAEEIEKNRDEWLAGWSDATGQA